MILQFIELGRKKLLNNLNYRFWLIFYFRWIFYIISFSSIFGILISSIILAVIYFNSEYRDIDAIQTIFLFNLQIWSLLGISISFILSFKKMFHISIQGHKFTLAKHCNIKKEFIKNVTVDDIRKIWRVWLLKTVLYILIFNISINAILTSNFYILISSIFIIGGFNMIYTFAFNKDINICQN